jgi:hypothetical protein
VFHVASPPESACYIVGSAEDAANAQFVAEVVFGGDNRANFSR